MYFGKDVPRNYIKHLKKGGEESNKGVVHRLHFCGYSTRIYSGGLFHEFCSDLHPFALGSVLTTNTTQ